MAIFPERVLGWINSALVWLFDALAGPLLLLPPLIGVSIVSLATALAMLPVIRRTSDQTRIRNTKRLIQAALLEIRLFNDDPRSVLRSLGDALRLNAVYLGLSLVPLVWMAVPLALVVAHLQALYGYAGLTPGVPALVKVELRDTGNGSDGGTGAALVAPAAVRVETSAVQLAAAHEVLWRVVPTAPGDYTLTIGIDGDSVTKTLHVSDRPARRSPMRVTGLLNQFLYPSEPPLSRTTHVASIGVSYPETAIAVIGWHIHWLIVYFVLTMVFAFALAGRFGVTL